MDASRDHSVHEGSMSKNIQKKKTNLLYFLPFEDVVEAEFMFLCVYIKTHKSGVRASGFHIEIESEIEPFDSVLQSSRYSRPILLIVLGVISFFTGKHLSVYSIESSASTVNNETIKYNRKNLHNYFKYNEIEFSDDINRIVSQIELEATQKNTLLFSLLDRWRKAQYLKEEGSDTGVFDDEAFLAYFHVLELLITEYDAEQRNEANKKCENFVDDLLKQTYKYRGNTFEQKRNEKIKFIKTVLNDELLNISQRIKYMLDKMAMLDERVSNLIDELVKIRNRVAHGRQVYRDKMIWPLPAFFMIMQQDEFLLEEIETLTARAVAKHYNLTLWEKEWDDFYQCLSPPLDSVLNFISNKIYEKISTDEFIDGKVNFVNPQSVLSAFLLKKLKFCQLEKSSKKLIVEISPDGDNSDWLLLLSAILADSLDEELSKRSSEIVEEINEKGIHNFSSIKDLYRYLDFNQVKVEWLYNWMVREGYSRKD